MMSAPEKTGGVPTYSVQSTIPPPGPAQPNAIPITLQWNMNPVSAEPNVYQGAPVWNVSSPPPQIILQNNNQQWTIQSSPPAYVLPPTTSQDAKLAPLQEMFLKGKPYALGIVLIITSILQIAFAISLPFFMSSVTFVSGILFWGPLFYIIAGSLSISFVKSPSVCKVKGSLALNIISSISSILAVILCIVDYSIVHCFDGYYFCSDDDGSAGFTIISFLLVMNLLIFCVSISVSVFGCRAVEHTPTNIPPVFVIQNDVVVSVPPSTLTPRTTQEHSIQPPPYGMVE
ncbi:membrane-spanning 4-domains subfamily A member 4A-like [Pyxicephalus adspersus]|uniref:membrane-spanning 4-domains subfamily A member 4A-like n=1 Tax=Pyxicephalus adspersus TaxID=30357 RepID=UPI003B5CCDC0